MIRYRQRNATFFAWLAAALLWGAADLVQADALDKLLMPGPVASDHAEFEEDCAQCHRELHKEDQSELCVACHDHDNIAVDQRDKTGFHGLDPRASTAPCKVCHADHLGRDAPLTRFDRETFDHQYTDFELKGRHSAASCVACHRPDEPYREAPGECFACHERDDSHDGKLGEKCADCHVESGWQRTEFDHDTDTEWPLEGAHIEVGCALCHAEETYEDTPTECVSCHRINDQHRGRYGRECDSCHVSEKWDEARFDHDKDTDWPLRGRHDKVACDTCHTGHLYDDDLGETCIDCHKKDDLHRGRNGEECGDCHSEKGWAKVAFDHDKDTDFKLLGKHEKLQCVACHRGSADENPQSDCFACHRNDDVHRGEQGEDCARCHNEKGWGEQVKFEHDITDFPLIGQHAVAPCEACHASATYQDVDSGCVDCHDADDVHELRLGPNCASCHNPNDWRLWLFDHTQDTEFELEGKHEGLECHACHLNPTEGEVEQSSSCYSCHQADDTHRGRFGRRCARCHNNESFSEIQVR